MPNPVASVDVFAYVDYRLFLAEYYRVRKAQDPKFSHRYITAQVKASSAGWFSDIVNGRTNLSGNHLLGLIKLFGLSDAAAEYFELLVRYDQAGSMDEKNQLYRKLITIRGVKPELIGMHRFEFYSAWYHSVIRELLFIHPFKGDYAALAKRLNPPITVAEARKSIQLLLDLGFIEKGPGGIMKPTDSVLKKDPAFKSMHLHNFLKENIRLGTESLESFQKEERDISAMTLCLSKTGFEKAREEIRALRNRLLALTDADSDPEKVYQCNFHMFPVSN
jgi:uncharacterized protein (TIGR02147 family)